MQFIIIIIIISFMELGRLLTRSCLTYPEVSSKVYHDSLCQLGSSVSLPWVNYFEAMYLHVVSSYAIHVLYNCTETRGEGRIVWKRSGQIIKEDTAVKTRGVLQE
jgi:hypothetical protein